MPKIGYLFETFICLDYHLFLTTLGLYIFARNSIYWATFMYLSPHSFLFFMYPLNQFEEQKSAFIPYKNPSIIIFLFYLQDKYSRKNFTLSLNFINLFPNKSKTYCSE